MATNEQTYLGLAIDSLQDEGYITLADDTNSYAVVARLCELAAEIGVVIDAEPAHERSCADCLLEDPESTPKMIEAARERHRELFG